MEKAICQQQFGYENHHETNSKYETFNKKLTFKNVNVKRIIE